VYVFFVLSGDALSTPFLRSGDRASVSRLAVKRYFRLTIPILMTCLLVWLLMRLSLTAHHTAAPLIHREDWLGSFLAIDASLVRCIRFALIGVYGKTDATTSYNPFLWTMSVEFIGSLLVFIVLYAWKDLKRPAACMVGVGLFLFALGSLFCLFFAGIAFAQWRASGSLARFATVRWQWAAGTLGLLTVVASVVVRSLSYEVQLLGGMLCALVLVAVCHVHAGAIRFFSSGMSSFLGRISFPLYLVQFPVLVSATSWWIVHAGALISLQQALWISLGSTALVIVLSVAFERVEAWLLRRANHTVTRVLA